MEIDYDTSIKSEFSKVKDTPIDSQESKLEPQIIPYQFCLSCGIPRNFNLVYSGICVYCMDEKKYCIYGDHEEDRPDFVDKHGDEHVRCNNCRGDEPTDFAESSHEPKLKPDDDQSRVVEPLMEIDPKIDNQPEHEIQSELGLEYRMDFDLPVNTGSQTGIKPWLGIKSQLDDESLLDDDPPAR
ncbi:hypothetical protein N7451_008111 [Penicillium sp. IBT 35674x]|nr:hypothetical protein N7451_008111 [Penicillium sp. IBT 35674x]